MYFRIRLPLEFFLICSFLYGVRSIPFFQLAQNHTHKNSVITRQGRTLGGGMGAYGRGRRVGRTPVLGWAEGGRRAGCCFVKSGRQIQEPGQFTRRCRISLAFFLEASYVRCLRFGTAGGIRGRSGPPGSFVSPWGRIGRL